MIVVVVGTRTEVGKTWHSAALLTELRARQISVSARKPVQSFDPSDASHRDSVVLSEASGEAENLVCRSHRNYEVAMAPPMAADFLGRPAFTTADLFEELELPRDDSVVCLIETAGGVRSPLAHDGDATDLCRYLRPDLVILVADAGLGAINAVRLSADALAQQRLVVALNRYDADDPIHRANLDWLAHSDGYDVVTSPNGSADLVVARITDRATHRDRL